MGQTAKTIAITTMILARLLSASPQTDGEHIDLQFRLHKDLIHTDPYGQNPAPYQKAQQNLASSPLRPPYPWQPAVPLWTSSDALFAGTGGFVTRLDTTTSPFSLSIVGDAPVNVLPTGQPQPQLPLQATTANTGGSIQPGTYLIAIGASLNGPVAPYFVLAVVPAGTTTNTIVVSGIVWQSAASAPAVWVGTSSLTMQSQVGSGTRWAGSSPDGFGNPTTITITSIWGQPGNLTYSSGDGYGLPDVVVNSLLVNAKTIVHGGDWGSTPTTIGFIGGHVTLQFAGASWGTNQWAGYVLSSYQWSVTYNDTVISNTADTLTMTGSGFAPGTAVVMRAAAKHITSNTIGDDNFANSFNANLGLTINAEAGNFIRIIAGTGAGQPLARIVSNTATVLTIDGTWLVTPDATSVYIIEEATWRYSFQTGTLNNSDYGNSIVTASFPLSNFTGASILIEVVALDSNDNWSVERYAPLREIYVPGSTIPGGGAGPVAPYIVPIVNGVATPDASKANNLLVLTEGVIVGQPINWSGGVDTKWALTIQQNPAQSAYASGTTYAAGDSVTYVVNGAPQTFTSLQGSNTGNEPDVSPAWWQEGGFTAAFDPTAYFSNVINSMATVGSPPNTQSYTDLSTNSSGQTSVEGQPSINEPIPI